MMTINSIRISIVIIVIIITIIISIIVIRFIVMCIAISFSITVSRISFTEGASPHMAARCKIVRPSTSFGQYCVSLSIYIYIYILTQLFAL